MNALGDVHPGELISRFGNCQCVLKLKSNLTYPPAISRQLTGETQS